MAGEAPRYGSLFIGGKEGARAPESFRKALAIDSTNTVAYEYFALRPIRERTAAMISAEGSQHQLQFAPSTDFTPTITSAV